MQAEREFQWEFPLVEYPETMRTDGRTSPLARFSPEPYKPENEQKYKPFSVTDLMANLELVIGNVEIDPKKIQLSYSPHKFVVEGCDGRVTLYASFQDKHRDVAAHAGLDMGPKTHRIVGGGIFFINRTELVFGRDSLEYGRLPYAALETFAALMKTELEKTYEITAIKVQCDPTSTPPRFWRYWTHYLDEFKGD
ncbi:hypothetical protein HZB02_02455 [Candidatus Woesearchaeota archaeon]|nr:hypothetical protein [Candidatus Woesearchaeota archaeon]